MSEPTSSSVTPKNNKSSTPARPSRHEKLYTGHSISFVFAPAHPQAMWEEHSHTDMQVMVFGAGSDCTVHWKKRGRWQQRQVQGEYVWMLGAQVAHRLEWNRQASRTVFYVAPRFAHESAGQTVRGSMLIDLKSVTKRDVQVLQWLKVFARKDQPKKATEVLRMKSAGTNLVVYLLQTLDRVEAGRVNGRHPGLSTEAFERIEKLIDRRIEEKITVEEMAREVHMSATNFHRLFKIRTGVSPIQHLISRRIGRAAELLCVRNYNISDVVFRAGFSSQSYFDRCFRRWRGCTPSRYRALFLRR